MRARTPTAAGKTRMPVPSEGVLLMAGAAVARPSYQGRKQAMRRDDGADGER